MCCSTVAFHYFSTNGSTNLFWERNYKWKKSSLCPYKRYYKDYAPFPCLTAWPPTKRTCIRRTLLKPGTFLLSIRKTKLDWTKGNGKTFNTSLIAVGWSGVTWFEYLLARVRSHDSLVTANVTRGSRATRDVWHMLHLPFRKSICPRSRKNSETKDWNAYRCLWHIVQVSNACNISLRILGAERSTCPVWHAIEIRHPILKE